MLNVLTDHQVKMIECEGYVAPITVFPPESAQRYRQALEKYEDSVSDRPVEETISTLSRFKPHLLFTWLDEICHNTVLLDAIEDLIGPNLLIYSTAFFTKNAHDAAYVPWHQDSTYAEFEGGRSVRAWVALTDSNSRNGCMRVIRGSHRRQLAHIDDPSDVNNILFRKERIAEDVDESLAVDLILNAGQMSVHEYGVIHGSNKNTSSDRRIGFAIAFITPETTTIGRRETAMLARGYASIDKWELEPRPKADLDQNAVIAHRRAMKIRNSYYYETSGADADI